MTDQFVLGGPAGRITVTPQALSRIVVGAVESVGGARVCRPRRGLEIRATERAASVSLALRASYGLVLPDLAREVQGRVAAVLARMLELEVRSIDVTIEELERP